MNYYYLGSSLPMLSWKDRPSMTVEQFIARCAEFVSPKELAMLDAVGGAAAEKVFPPASPVTQYALWDNNLRNQIARRRAARNQDISGMLHPECTYYSEIEPIVQDAAGKGNPLEREEAIDAARFRRLEDLEAGHAFDFDFLCIYKLKLALLGKYRELTAERGREHFRRAVDAIADAAKK